MPPELSAPSLSRTTAPIGRLEASDTTCFIASPSRVAVRGTLSSLSGLSMRSSRGACAIKSNLKFLL